MKASATTTPVTDLEAWDNARILVGFFGKYLDLFTTTIRTLRTNNGDDDRAPPRRLDPGSRFSLLRLTSSPSLRAKLYFAGKTFYPQRLPKGIESESLISMFNAHELSSLLTVIILFQMAHKICEEEYWKRIADRISLFADGGMYLGMAMPSIGPSTGVLIGSLRYLTFAAFQKSCPDRYSNYSRELRTKALPYDLDLEREYWRTTHVHVGAALLQQMGFGKEFSQDYYFGLIEHEGIDLSHRARLIKAGLLWLDSLLLRGEAPESEEADEINIEDEDADLLLHRLEELKKSGSPYNWLSKTGDDLPSVDVP